MNNVQAQDYLRAALIAAGMQADRIRVGMELAQGTTHSTAPSASIYAVETVLRREKKTHRILASQLTPSVAGATGGTRQSVAQGTTTFEVTLAERSPADVQNLLVKLIEHLVDVPLVDAVGESFVVLAASDQLKIEWNDHDTAGQVVVTMQVAMPFAVWVDHPIIPIEIVVQYRLEGGNPSE